MKLDEWDKEFIREFTFILILCICFIVVGGAVLVAIAALFGVPVEPCK